MKQKRKAVVGPATEADAFWLRLLDRAGSLEEAKRRFARAVVRAAIRCGSGSHTAVARELGIHRNTLTRYAHLEAKENES